jgi:hypothetical protein
VHALRRRVGALLMERGRVVAGPHADRRRYRHLLCIVAVLALAGCGGSSGGNPPTISIGAAKTFSLVTHESGTRLTLKILQPNGAPMTRFKRGAGPHTGVHVIVVRRDLSVILHQHPPVHPNGDFSIDVGSLPPGPYKIVVDVYPASGPQPNFQVTSSLTRPGSYAPAALPPLARVETVDGVTFTLHSLPHLMAIQPAFLHFTVTEHGRPARFTTWYGALAHAIFFRRGTLDYFHTHVCAPGASGCTSVFGAAKVTGTSATPGKLDVGVLVPVSGTWRLFLQCKVGGRVLTAPFTLTVR